MDGRAAGALNRGRTQPTINPGSFYTILVRNGSLLMEDCQIGDDTTAAGQRGRLTDRSNLDRLLDVRLDQF